MADNGLRNLRDAFFRIRMGVIIGRYILRADCDDYKCNNREGKFASYYTGPTSLNNS